MDSQSVRQLRWLYKNVFGQVQGAAKPAGCGGDQPRGAEAGDAATGGILSLLEDPVWRGVG